MCTVHQYQFAFMNYHDKGKEIFAVVMKIWKEYYIGFALRKAVIELLTPLILTPCSAQGIPHGNLGKKSSSVVFAFNCELRVEKHCMSWLFSKESIWASRSSCMSKEAIEKLSVAV